MIKRHIVTSHPFHGLAKWVWRTGPGMSHVLSGRACLCALLVAVTTVTSSCSGDDDKPQNDDPQDTQATTSGGLATINTGNAVLGFIPVGNSLVMIELESQTDNVKPDSEFRMLAESVSIDTSFVIDSCGADSRERQVACVGYSSSMLAIIDLVGFLADGTAPSIVEVDTGASSTGSFSGGNCINCGVLIDTKTMSAIVSSSDGYRLFDYQGDLQAEYLSDAETDPPRNFATENFSFDPQRRVIISPEYSTVNQYLWLINVNTDDVHRWDHRLVSSAIDEEEGLQSLADAGITGSMVADSAAVDPRTGIVTIGDEYTQGLLMINLETAEYNDAAGTFSAVDSAVVLDYPYSQYLTTGQAIEPVSHLLFLEDEFGASMGVGQLPQETSSLPPVLSKWVGVQIPNPGEVCPGVFRWSNVGDPHGLSIFTSNSTGKDPKGLLINSAKSCAAVVSLQALLDSPLDPAFDGQFIVDPAFDLVQEGVLKFIEIVQPE